MSLQER